MIKSTASEASLTPPIKKSWKTVWWTLDNNRQHLDLIAGVPADSRRGGWQLHGHWLGGHASQQISGPEAFPDLVFPRIPAQ